MLTGSSHELDCSNPFSKCGHFYGERKTGDSYGYAALSCYECCEMPEILVVVVSNLVVYSFSSQGKLLLRVIVDVKP